MLRFAFHLLLYGTLALLACGIVVGALAVWWRARGAGRGKRAVLLALAVVGILLLLLGAKCARGLMHRANAAETPILPRAITPRPDTPKPDDETFYATPRPNLPNPPPRPPAPPHKPSPPHPVEHPHPT